MAENRKSLTINIIWNGILSLSQILFPLITFPYITRVLGVEANGANSFALSVVNYFALFATLGMSTYGVKACAQEKNDKEQLSKVVQELLFISGIATVIVIAVLYISIFTVPLFIGYAALMFVYSFNIWLNVIGVNWLFQGIEKFRYITTLAILFKIISIVFMFIFVKKPSDVVIYAAISVFASYGGNIINLIYSCKFISYKKKWKYDIRRHLKPIMFLFATALAVNIYSHMDSVMLGAICGDYDTGIYYVAVKVKTILITLVSSFSVVIMSRLSYVKNNEKQGFFELLKKSYAVIIMITIPLVLFFSICARDSVLFLSGKDYMDSVRPMQILMPTIFISAVSQIIGNQYSVAVGKEKNLMMAVVVGAIVNLIVNCILIPRLTYNGAAIGTICAETSQCIVQMILAKDMVKKVFSLKKIKQVLIAVCIPCVILIMINNWFSTSMPFLNLVIDASAFFLCYIIILLLEKYDICIDFIESFVKKIKSK